MLTLVQESPGGQKSVIVLDAIEKFEGIQAGTELFEDKEKVWVTYFGVCDSSCVFVQSKTNKKMYLCYVKSGNVYSYDAGQPVKVVMTFNRCVNGESLGSKEDHHVGVLYDYRVIWEQPGERTKIGVLVTEVLEQQAATGWFAQAQDRRQQRLTAMTPDTIGKDFIGISTAKTDTSAFSTEIASDTAHSESASSDSQGEMVFFQHFEYITNVGIGAPIPHSGFLLTKRLEKGKLFVTRQGVSKGNITAGEADGMTYEL